MSKVTQKTKKTPALRFPEFSGEWEEKKLGEILDYEQPTNYIVESTEYSNDYSIPVLTPGKTFILGYTNEQAGIYPKKKLPVIIFDDFTTSKQFVDFSFKVKSSAMKILSNSDNNTSDIRFIFSAMQRIRFALGAEHKRFWISTYSKIRIPFPTLPEQQKIANFLTAVDEWIENLKGQKGAWEEYKKGLMQKMFPSEDGQAPEIRFKIKNKNGELVEPPEWEEKRLGDLGVTVNGLTGKTKEDFGEGEPFISYKQIFESSKINTDKFSFVKIKDEGKQNRIKFGDVLFTTSSETSLEVGFASVLLDHDVEPYLNSFAFALRPNSLKELNPYFGRFFFRSSYFRDKVVRLAQGSTRFNLSKLAFMKLAVLLPTYNEQQKIASFLGSLDEVIDSYQQKITHAEEWKKGLMQRMFV